jgi:FKBP-type peptidyl-prolyl cis-trans isomerase
MKIMKKFRLLGLILCVAMFFTFTSCSQLVDPVKEAEKQAEQEEAANGDSSTDTEEPQTQDPETELETTVIKEGTGPKAKKGDTVQMLYIGTYNDGSQFDANATEKKDGTLKLAKDKDLFEFTLGDGQVIQGWEQGVLGMKKGEVKKLVVPSSLAYNDGKTNNFLVELVKIK